MTHDELLFEKIENYLRNALPPEERAALETDMAADPKLARLVKQHQLERQAQELLVKNEVLAKMQQWDVEAAQAERVMRPRVTLRVVRWAWATAAALALGLGIWWLAERSDTDTTAPLATDNTQKELPKKSPAPISKPPIAKKPAPKSKSETRPPIAETTPKTSTKPPETPQPKPKTPAPPPRPDYPALAAAFYRESDFSLAKKGSGLESAMYDRAAKNFEGGKYSEVVQSLEPTLKLNPDALKTKELLAHALYKNRQYDSAIRYFRQLSSASDRAISERADWALALALLHRMPAQQTLLNRVLDKILTKPGHPFQAKARDLKARLG